MYTTLWYICDVLGSIQRVLTLSEPDNRLTAHAKRVSSGMILTADTFGLLLLRLEAPRNTETPL
jgi:hypothetical protein